MFDLDTALKPRRQRKFDDRNQQVIQPLQRGESLEYAVCTGVVGNRDRALKEYILITLFDLDDR